MIRARRIADQFVAAALLQVASGLVPRGQREEWRAEWKGEIWQVIHASSADWQGTVFTCGAFKDAYLLRTDGRKPRAFHALAHGSALRCLALIFVVGLVGFLTCIASPSARMALAPSSSDTTRTVLISGDRGYRGIEVPSVRIADYRRWRTETRHLYSAMAFYQPSVESVTAGKHSLKHVKVAVASQSMLSFLNLTPALKVALEQNQSTHPLLLVTSNLYQALFHGKSDAITRSIQVGGQRVTITSVVTGEAWPLPSSITAWLIEPPNVLNRISAASRGFVVARVNPGGSAASLGSCWYMFVPQPEGGLSRFTCIAISGILHAPIWVLWEMLCLALAALPATTPLDLGDYPHHPNRHFALSTIPRWIFFAFKIALIVPSVCFWSIALAYYANPLGSLAAVYIQMVVAFLGFLFAFRWAWRDQRRRCPVCLQLLSNPAHVGRASHSFLDWSGTEWICSKGPGFLHIPEIPTSWLSIQCWLHMNPSWHSLFSDTCIE